MNWELEEKDKFSEMYDFVETFRHAKCPVVRRIEAQIKKAEKDEETFRKLLHCQQLNSYPQTSCWWKQLNYIKVSGIIVVLLILALCVGIQIGTRLSRPKPIPCTLFGFRTYPYIY